VAVDTSTLRLLPASFQRYVRPDQHPRLSAFCTELTSITQDMWVLLRRCVQLGGGVCGRCVLVCV
jgi:hypothetical protein